MSVSGQQSGFFVPTPKSKCPILIEVCVDSVESAQAAIAGGANRLEVCGNLGLGGGTTPSIGLVKAIKKACPDVPLMAMVRPRAGDFVYNDTERDVMVEDIKQFKLAGVSGVVFGVLERDGSIDSQRTSQLVGVATESGLQVCFHRAFDMVENQFKALNSIISLGGITRILTSGGGASAPSSLETLDRLYITLRKGDPTSQAPLILMPGSGINGKTIGPLLKRLLPLGLTELHLSGGQWHDGAMAHRPSGMGMGIGGGGGDWGIWKTNEQSIREVRSIVNTVWEEYMNHWDT